MKSRITISSIVFIFLLLNGIEAQNINLPIYTKGGGFEPDTIVTYKDVADGGLQLYIFYPDDLYHKRCAGQNGVGSHCIFDMPDTAFCGVVYAQKASLKSITSIPLS